MSSKILNDGKLSNNLDEHMHKHLLPKYNWYIINIFTKIYSHKTNNFIGTNNLEVNRNHSNSITFNFKENDIESNPNVNNLNRRRQSDNFQNPVINRKKGVLNI